MRIAFDLDGVLADLHQSFAQEASRLFPEVDAATLAPEVGASPPDGGSAAVLEAAAGQPPLLTRRQIEEVWRSLTATENYWQTLSETEPGIVARLAELAESRRWEILFVTSRPMSSGHTVQRQTQRWLEKHGFPLPSVFVAHGSRGLMAKALGMDVVVDDRQSNCVQVVTESEAAAILVWRGRQERMVASGRRRGFIVVPTVAACLDALVEIDRPEASDSFLQRLRRLFG